MLNNYLEIKKKIITNGFYLIKNFLENKDIYYLKKILDQNIQKNSKDSFIPFRTKDLINSIFSFKLENIKKNYFINRIKKKYHLKTIASNILENKNELYAVDSYKSKKNKNMVIPWHTDQAYSGKEVVNENEFVNPDMAALKFFFYLSDVDSDNGCLGYIPGSHKISYYLKKLILEKKIEYSRYWSLHDYRNLVMSDYVKKKLLNYISPEEIEEFIKNSSFVDSPIKDTKLFDIEAPEGSLLIFDESGVHRGAALNKSDRLCLRFFFRKII